MACPKFCSPEEMTLILFPALFSTPLAVLCQDVPQVASRSTHYMTATEAPVPPGICDSVLLSDCCSFRSRGFASTLFHILFWGARYHCSGNLADPVGSLWIWDRTPSSEIQFFVFEMSSTDGSAHTGSTAQPLWPWLSLPETPQQFCLSCDSPGSSLTFSVFAKAFVIT